MNAHEYVHISPILEPSARDAAEDLTVEQLMTPGPVVVAETASVDEAIRLLEENSVSGLPVVDAEGVLIGVISETDIVRARAVGPLWRRWPGLRVRHLMHSPAMTADRSMSLEDAAKLMEHTNVHRLVVVDDDQTTPIGVISASDLVRALARRPTDG
jgi:CBS domain-containing protein